MSSLNRFAMNLVARIKTDDFSSHIGVCTCEQRWSPLPDEEDNKCKDIRA